jgi:hypothetical protein
VLVLSLSALSQSMPSMVPQTIEFPSGKLRLKGYLWKPAGPGSFPLSCSITVKEATMLTTLPECRLPRLANVLAPFFVKHG